jgi:phosphatidylserine decarboxylase
MNNKIFVLDRATKEVVEEKVYGRAAIEAFYGKSSFLSSWCLFLIACYPFASKLYGSLQSSRWSRRKVIPFVEKFRVEASEFLYPPEFFTSFNDFFIRKLKRESRPFAGGKDVAIMPADGRYLVYPNIEKADGFVVKGKKFSLEELLQDKKLAQTYAKGSMVIARLCPTDYHRFHFPCSCLPSSPKRIEGHLHSVNPLALRKKIEILSQNKREITELQTSNFGKVLFIEVGATFVGSIHHTFSPNEPYAKGDEKGYFSFGGSSLILLFEPGRIQFDQDLIEASADKVEVKALMGQSLGLSLTP